MDKSIGKSGNMKTLKTPAVWIFACVAVIAAAAAVTLAIDNRALREKLVRADAELAKAKAAPPPPRARRPAPAAIRQAAPAQEPSAQGQAVDPDELEKTIEERAKARADAIDRERREEHEARRREWENASEEEREERRKEFRARIKEHFAAQLADFVEKTGLDDAQCASLEFELDALNGRVREIAEEFAAAIDDGVPLDVELQLQMLHAFSGATLDAYAGFDEVLPEDWRERGEGYNMMFGISPDSMSPLFDAIYRSGVTPGGPGGFGPIPPPPQRQ